MGQSVMSLFGQCIATTLCWDAFDQCSSVHPSAGAALEEEMACMWWHRRSSSLADDDFDVAFVAETIVQ